MAGAHEEHLKGAMRHISEGAGCGEWLSDGSTLPGKEGGVVQQDAEKVRRPVLFIWSVRSVWFVWLH